MAECHRAGASDLDGPFEPGLRRQRRRRHATGSSSSSRAGIDPGAAARRDGADDLSRHPHASPRRRRARPARSRLPSAVLEQRPLLRLLHARRATARWSSRNTACLRNPNVADSGRDRAADDPASDQRQPQRRHARLRARRLSLRRRRRRRRRQRPAEQRAEHQRAARQDPAHRRRSPGSRGGHGVFVAADNPFVGRAGRDEIFAFGWRNPWRFSFDRQTGQQWVADVGQGAREEVDTPVVKGGNYGWRVYEGIACTDIDPALCIPGNYISPIFDYTHSNGRCSITGGYVYRGAQGALPLGTYVYGDYCTGEIFAWNGSAQTLAARHRA